LASHAGGFAVAAFGICSSWRLPLNRAHAACKAMALTELKGYTKINYGDDINKGESLHDHQ
jgi:hypothetical protein